MIRRTLTGLLLILSIGCGTCREQVAITRLGIESSLSALAPMAPAVMGPERAEDWLRATRALVSAALAEWERSCPPEPSDGPQRASARPPCQCPDPGSR